MDKILFEKGHKLLELFGIPLSSWTPRRVDRIVKCFLCLLDVKTVQDLSSPKDVGTPFHMKTRDIIQYLNANYGENIASGSYDDIRRKDLKMLILGGIVLQSSPNSATNDGTRGYGVNPIYAKAVQKLATESDDNRAMIIDKTLGSTKTLKDKLERNRDIKLIPIDVGTEEILFSNGEHNILQKKIVEELLPRYGYGAKVLYIGDTADKYLYMREKELKDINFFTLSHEELPDIVAYSEARNRLYLIEAVHTSGPISEVRLLQLKEITKDCTADIVYITCFLDKSAFRTYVKDIAWETEVWVAENPDHLIHFNGDKFLGPYKPNQESV